MHISIVRYIGKKPNSKNCKMIKKIYILAFLLTLTSCGTYSESYFDVSRPGSPTMRWMYDGPPSRDDGKQYPPMYVDGWKDGCETGASANTNDFYKYYNHFKQDWKKAQDDVYYKGWKDAFSYCGRYIYQYYRKVGFF